MWIKRIIIAALVMMTLSCVNQSIPLPLEQSGEHHADVSSNSVGVDTDCSYFYFLWARTAENNGRYDEALEAYEKAMVCDEQAEYVIRHLATLLLQMNRKQQALTWVEKIVASRPDDAKIKIFQADIYSAMGEHSKAITIYKEVLAADPNNTGLILKLGKHYLNNFDYLEARNIFEDFVVQEPDSFIGHFYLAKLYRELKFNQKAVSSYQKALQYNWSAPLALEAAEFFESQEMFEDAISLYRKVLEDDENIEVAGGRLVKVFLRMNEPDKALEILAELRNSVSDSTKIDFIIGRIFLEQEKYPEAVALFSEMLADNPNQDAVRSLLALAYYESGDSPKAKSLLLEVLQGDEGYDEALYMLIRIYTDEDDFDSAVGLANRAIAENSENKLNYYFILASLYEEQGKVAEAEKVLLQVISLFSDSTEVYFKYGIFLERYGRIEEAMVHMEKILELNPDDPYALNYVGYSWADKGINLDHALDYIKKALVIKPNDGFIQDSLGWVYYKKGNIEQAITEMKKAIAIEPDDPTIHEHLGDIYLAGGKQKEALEYYRRSLDLHVNEEDKLRLRGKIEGVKE